MHKSVLCEKDIEVTQAVCAPLQRCLSHFLRFLLRPSALPAAPPSVERSEGRAKRDTSLTLLAKGPSLGRPQGDKQCVALRTGGCERSSLTLRYLTTFGRA